MNHVVSNRVVLGVKYDGKAINGFTFATQPELFTKIFAAETTEGDAAAALKDGKLLVGKTIADDRGWHVGQKVKATAENIVVDKEATAKAQADYQAKVQAHVRNCSRRPSNWPHPATWQERRPRLRNRTVHERRQERRSENAGQDEEGHHRKDADHRRDRVEFRIPRFRDRQRRFGRADRQQADHVRHAGVRHGQAGRRHGPSQEGPEENNQEILHNRRVRPRRVQVHDELDDRSDAHGPVRVAGFVHHHRHFRHREHAGVERVGTHQARLVCSVPSARHVARCVACLASKRRSSPCSARCWVWSSASPREW